MSLSRSAFAAVMLTSLAVIAQPVTAQAVTEATLANLEYREIGPTRQSGRFVDIAVPRVSRHLGELGLERIRRRQFDRPL